MPPLSRKPKPSEPAAPETAASPIPAHRPWDDWPIQEIPLAEISDHGHTHRTKAPPAAGDEAMKYLMAQIRAHGLLQPILVYRRFDRAAKGVRNGEEYARVFGSRRCRAMELLGSPTIAARIMPTVPTDDEVHELRAIENFARAELNPAEKAIAAYEMVNAAGMVGGLDARIVRVAAALGVGETWVRDCLYIVERLSPGTKEYLAAGSLNLGQARELAKVGDPRLQEEFAKRIAKALEPPSSQSEATYSGRIVAVLEIRGWLENVKRSLKVIPWDPAAAMATGVEGCRACVGCRFNTATDVTLFGTSKDETGDKGLGCCLNARGYEAKERLTAKAIDKARDKIAADMKSKKTTAEEARSLDGVRAVLPEFVKPASGQRKIVKDLHLQPPGTKAAAQAKQAEKPKERDRAWEALCAWGGKYEQWARAQMAAVKKAALADPAKLLCWLALNETQEWKEKPDYHVPKDWQSQKQTQPPEEKAMSPKLAALLKSAAKGDALAIAGCLTAKELDMYIRNANAGPELTAAYARAFGVEPPAAPVYTAPATGAGAAKPEAKAGKGARKSAAGGEDLDTDFNSGSDDA